MELRVGSAFPDPPFEVAGATPTGFHIDLMTAIAAELGDAPVWHRYEGADFDGIFAELGRSIDDLSLVALWHDARHARCRGADQSGRAGLAGAGGGGARL